MKQKYIVLIIISFLLTGCNIEYNLNIDKDLKFQEDITINATLSNEINKINEFNQYIPIDYRADDISIYEKKSKDVEYYEITKKNNNINFKYNFDIEEYTHSNLASNCYKHIVATKSDDKLILSTSKEFLCFDTYKELDEVTIKITSRYKLIDTNSDSKENYTYIWKINKENYKDKNIYLSMDSTNRKESLWEKFQETGFYKYGLFIIIIIIVFLLYKILKFFSKKRDEI